MRPNRPYAPVFRAPSLGKALGRLVILGSCLAATLPAAGYAIGDAVFIDSDGDGVKDGGEPGYGGVTVRLYDVGADGLIGTADDAYVSQTVTNGAGNYTFAGVDNGDYYLVFTAPTGKIFTLQNQGADDALDSDVDASGTTDTITIAGGDDNDWDAGLITPASIGDYVWHDHDYDGLQDSSESGIANVTVELWNSVTASQVGQTSTDSSGEYAFTNITGGSYYIKVVLPAGYDYAPQNEGTDDDLDSDVDTGTGESAPLIVLTGGDNLTCWDAGLYQQVDISGLAWEDEDGDGLRDDGESGLEAVDVALYDPGDDNAIGGAGGDADVLVDTTTTNANGEYEFADLEPGAYFVEFVDPGGLRLVPMNRGADDSIDSDVNPATAYTEVLGLLSGGDLTTLDAGFAQFQTVGDLVFLDTDEDGVQDGGESGVADAIVIAYGPGEDGAIGGNDDELLTQATTAADGSYALNVVAGSIYLRVVPPAGYTFTLQDAGSDDTADSDVNATTGLTALYTVATGVDDDTLDAGLRADADGDGTADSADACPDDSWKTAPGDCGCGTRDVDSDEDGVADCIDNCPTTANPGQADTDGDGVGNACQEVAGASTGDADGGSAATTGADTNADAPGTQDLLNNCGLCGPIGLVSYSVCVIGYGSFLVARRRRG